MWDSMPPQRLYGTARPVEKGKAFSRLAWTSVVSIPCLVSCLVGEHLVLGAGAPACLAPDAQAQAYGSDTPHNAHPW